MTEEYDRDEKVNTEFTTRDILYLLPISTAITAFGIWVINSYESYQQGYKWVIFGLITLFSGVMVLMCITQIIDKYLREIIIYKQIKKSFFSFLGASIFNGIGLSRLYESFERPDANNDGLFTISDVGIHAKETFYASGDRFAVWFANTDVGQFFEMNKVTPSPTLAFFVSFFLWGLFWAAWQEFTTVEDSEYKNYEDDEYIFDGDDEYKTDEDK